MNMHTTATFMITMAVVKFADSLMPITRIVVITMITTNPT